MDISYLDKHVLYRVGDNHFLDYVITLDGHDVTKEHFKPIKDYLRDGYSLYTLEQTIELIECLNIGQAPYETEWTEITNKEYCWLMSSCSLGSFQQGAYWIPDAVTFPWVLYCVEFEGRYYKARKSVKRSSNEYIEQVSRQTRGSSPLL